MDGTIINERVFVMSDFCIPFDSPKLPVVGGVATPPSRCTFLFHFFHLLTPCEFKKVCAWVEAFAS